MPRSSSRRLLDDRRPKRAALAAKPATENNGCGRAIEVTAVTARSRTKKRDLDLKKVRWLSDPVALACDPAIDVLVEVIGGEGDPAKRAAATSFRLLRDGGQIKLHVSCASGINGNDLALAGPRF